MKIKTASGIVSGNKRSPYIKWLQGWINGGGWSGATTIRAAWDVAVSNGKPSGCSWMAYGYLMACCQNQGRRLAGKELKELM